MTNLSASSPPTQLEQQVKQVEEEASQRLNAAEAHQAQQLGQIREQVRMVKREFKVINKDCWRLVRAAVEQTFASHQTCCFKTLKFSLATTCPPAAQRVNHSQGCLTWGAVAGVGTEHGRAFCWGGLQACPGGCGHFVHECDEGVVG